MGSQFLQDGFLDVDIDGFSTVPNVIVLTISSIALIIQCAIGGLGCYKMHQKGKVNPKLRAIFIIAVLCAWCSTITIITRSILRTFVYDHNHYTSTTRILFLLFHVANACVFFMSTDHPDRAIESDVRRFHVRNVQKDRIRICLQMCASVTRHAATSVLDVV